MATIEAYFKQFGATKPGDIHWSHAVNSRERLARFLNDPVTMIIESDIRISSAGIVVAAHPPETESDLTLDELIASMQRSKQGLKLDFKDPEILVSCLEKLREISLPQPIFLNADILQGNGANAPKFSAIGFLALCKKYYPAGILSVGWTTAANPERGYTKQNIDEMLALCHDIAEVTFPVRACLLPNSSAEIERLIKKEGRTLTIWNNEPVSDELRDWIKNNTDPKRTFYDFIDENKEPIKLW
jgi:hypothetical protein